MARPNSCRRPSSRSAIAAAEASFFDRLIADHGDFNPFTERGWLTISRRFREWAARPGKLTLLDVGCGTGKSRLIYERFVSRYVGIDLSTAAIRIARQRFPQQQWLIGDACELPFGAESFDVVAFSSILHHLVDLRPALLEANRVLKPGGTVFAFDPNLFHPAMALLRHPRSPLYLSDGVSPNERPLSPSYIRSHFFSAGFTLIRQRAQSDIPYRAVTPQWLSWCLSLYNAADWALEWIGLGRWFGSFVITAGSKT